SLLLREVIPIYGLTALALWMATWLWGGRSWTLGREWADAWKGRHAFGLSLAGLLWIHLCLWWQVPPSLWALPVLSRTPCGILSPLLALAFLAPALLGLRGRKASSPHAAAALGGWLVLWTLFAQVPFLVHRPPASTGKPASPVKILV